MIKRIRARSPKYFLSRSEMKSLVARVERFERVTGCELVFHFRRTLGPDPEAFNQELFYRFKLNETSDHRALLITLGLRDRKFAVWADEGVEKTAGRELHRRLANHLVPHLRDHRHLDALIGAADVAEEALKHSAPAGHKEHSKNELPDKPIIEGEE